jgi:hypothetical protein
MFERRRDVAYFAQVVVNEELGTVVRLQRGPRRRRASRAGDEPGLTTVSSDVTEPEAIRTTEPLGLITRSLPAL